MLYFIGLGLADEKDITVKGLEIVKRAERVYLEAYTAILLVGKDKLVLYIPSRPFVSTWQGCYGTDQVGSLLWPSRSSGRQGNGRVEQRGHPRQCRRSRRSISSRWGSLWVRTSRLGLKGSIVTHLD